MKVTMIGRIGIGCVCFAGHLAGAAEEKQEALKESDVFSVREGRFFLDG